MKMIHFHTSTPRVIPLGYLIQNSHITHVRYLSKTNKKIRSQSLDDAIQSCLTKMILVPQNAKILCNIANHGYTMTHARPVYIQR